MTDKKNEYVNILGFAGSLSKDSYNKMLLKAAQILSSEYAKIEIFDLESIKINKIIFK